MRPDQKPNGGWEEDAETKKFSDSTGMRILEMGMSGGEVWKEHGGMKRENRDGSDIEMERSNVECTFYVNLVKTNDDPRKNEQVGDNQLKAFPFVPQKYTYTLYSR